MVKDMTASDFLLWLLVTSYSNVKNEAVWIVMLEINQQYVSQFNITLNCAGNVQPKRCGLTLTKVKVNIQKTGYLIAVQKIISLLKSFDLLLLLLFPLLPPCWKCFEALFLEKTASGSSLFWEDNADAISFSHTHRLCPSGLICSLQETAMYREEQLCLTWFL